MSNDLPFLIAGGGIGGLVAALALARTGRTSHVLEQAPDFGEVGAGIQLGPNVFRMFEKLELTEAVSDLAFFPQYLSMRDGRTGDEITRLPVGSAAFRERYRYPYGVIYRRDLLDVLVAACRASPLIRLPTFIKGLSPEKFQEVWLRDLCSSLLLRCFLKTSIYYLPTR